MKPIHIHYAVQACDIKSYQGNKRFCGDDRTMLSKKSFKSLVQSIKLCADLKPETVHHVAIFDDHCTEDLRALHQRCIDQYSSDQISFEVIPLPKQETASAGIRESIRACYLWMQKHGQDFVFQIQDDYMFDQDAMYEMIDIWYQIFNETQSHAVINPWNDPDLWYSLYRNKSTPRAFIPGKNRYWIQGYDTACTFLTSHQQFSQHWDLYNDFFYLIDKIDKTNGMLENKSLNHMFVQRGILMLMPVDSVAWHMQAPEDEDPYIPWQPIWDAIDVS
jgi:hypothetical protein